MMRRPGFKWLALPAVMVVMTLGLSGSPASATTPGWVDLSFGIGGVAALPATTLSGTTVVDSTGRAVVLGTTNAAGSADRVTRMTVNGGVDSTFGTGGTFSLPAATFYTQIVIGPTGSIYLLGGDAAANGSSSQIVVTKLTSAGAPDATFGTGGTATTAVSAINAPNYSLSDLTVRSDGDVIVSLITKDASQTGILVALTPAGVLDTTFGPGTTHGWVVLPSGQFPYSPKADPSSTSTGVLVATAAAPPVFNFEVFSGTGALGLSPTFPAGQTPLALAANAGGSFWATGNVGQTVFLSFIGGSGAMSTVLGPSETCAPGGGQIVSAGSVVYVIASNTDSSTGCDPSPAIVLRFGAGAIDGGFGASGEVNVDFLSSLTVFGPNGGGLQPDGHLLVGVNGTTDSAFKTQNAAVVRINTAPAPAAVQAFVQGANDTFFTAENVAANPGRFVLTPSPVVDGGGVTDVFLLGTDNHLYIAQRLASGWSAPVDLTASVAGTPGLGSAPHAVLSGSVLHVFGLAASGTDLLDYHNDKPGGGWLVTDVSQAAPSSALINPTLSAVILGGTLHVYATSQTGDLIEIDNDNVGNHQWNFYDESSSAGGGVATSGAPGALLINGTPHVYTRASGTNDLVEFVADHVGGRVWNAYDQTHSAPGSPTLSGNPIPALIGTTPHVYVDDAHTGDLVEFVADHLAGRIWNSYDQTTGSGAPQLSGNPSVVLVDGTQYGQPGTQVPEVFEDADGTMAVVAADHQAGAIWNSYDVSELSGGSPVSGDPSVVANGATVVVLALTAPQGGASLAANVRVAAASGPSAHVLTTGQARLGPFAAANGIDRLTGR